MGVVLETKSMCKGQRKLGTVQTGHREVNLDLMRESSDRKSWAWGSKNGDTKKKYQEVAHQKLLHWNSQISFNFLVSNLTSCLNHCSYQQGMRLSCFQISYICQYNVYVIAP